MGRFASHLKVVAEQTKPCSFTSLEYTFVDYARLTTLAKECAGSPDNCNAFRDAWIKELERSTANFDEHYITASNIVFDAMFDCDEEIDKSEEELNSSPDPHNYNAIDLLLKRKGRDFALCLLQEYKMMLQSASLNSEALDLALKKYTKRRTAAAKEAGLPKPKMVLLRDLGPMLYNSTPHHATGAHSLAGELQFTREYLERDYDVDYSIGTFKTAEAAKEGEYAWFLHNVKKLEEKELAAYVAHRGFHCIDDNSVSRPIENSLSSFEYAWGAGVHLCECDVGVTKDEKIIMCHDEDFQRLALMSSVKAATTVVKDLTLADIMRMPLKHGSRPPLLVDVLRSAMAIGDHAKLVIEIKPGNSEIVEPLMMLFKRHPSLLSRVAVIMSFDSYVIEEIADLFAVSNTTNGTGGERDGKESSRRISLTRARSQQLARCQSDSHGVNTCSIDNEGYYTPKLMILTELEDASASDNVLTTTVTNGFVSLGIMLPRINGIDGVYIQYEPYMLEPKGKAEMLKLAESYIVGVWMLAKRDPDAKSVARKLVNECGVSFVNTDFGRNFFSS